MKTTVESIMVQNDHGIVPVRIRMPNGDLKRRFLRSMLENGSVLPQVVVNKILLEVLRELDSVYRTRRVYMDTALELKGVVDAINEKWHSDVEVHEAENADLREDLNDLQADMAEAYYEKRVSEVAKAVRDEEDNQ